MLPPPRCSERAPAVMRSASNILHDDAVQRDSISAEDEHWSGNGYKRLVSETIDTQSP